MIAFNRFPLDDRLQTINSLAYTWHKEHSIEIRHKHKIEEKEKNRAEEGNPLQTKQRTTNNYVVTFEFINNTLLLTVQPASQMKLIPQK